MTAAGLTLLALVPLLVVDGIVEARGGMGGEFWRRPIDGKLDHIVGHRREWWVMGAMWIGILAAAMGGTTALVAAVGDGWAWVGLGALAISAACWLIGVVLQTAGGAVAATQRAEQGVTPDWVHPLWSAAWMCELSWVVVANLAYVAIGVGVLREGAPGAWAGWAAILGGGLFVAAVAATRRAFPQLALLVPIALGVAALLA